MAEQQKRNPNVQPERNRTPGARGPQANPETDVKEPARTLRGSVKDVTTVEGFFNTVPEGEDEETSSATLPGGTKVEGPKSAVDAVKSAPPARGK
jgi:hypothetical protein